MANGLLALSSAAVMAVYAAGYERTRSAADRFALQAEARRPMVPSAAPVPTVAPSPAPASVPAAAAPSTARAIIPAPAPQVKKRRPRPAPAANAPVAAPAMNEPVPAAVASPAMPAAEPPTPPPADVATTVAPTPPGATVRYKDGTYYGWGTSRHGDIQAAVVIEDGRIASATIAQCLTRYSCNVIATLPPQVAQRQSPEVDYVSGATQSTNAFYYAVVDALSKAK
jgi:uncharacterized protein with FMN-binding domain